MFGIDDAIAAGLKVLNKFIPDPAAKALAEKELRDSLLAADKGQMEVNAVEAAHRSIFVAGWRPFIGWTCGIAFLYHFIVVPSVQFGFAMYGENIPLPTFDMNALLTVLLGMLGFGGMRSYEKIKGITK